MSNNQDNPPDTQSKVVTEPVVDKYREENIKNLRDIQENSLKVVIKYISEDSDSKISEIQEQIQQKIKI